MGLPGYEGILWIGVVAPAGTPKPVIGKLALAFQRAVRTPELAERLKRDGVEPVGGTPEAFGALVRAETARWAKVITEANLAGTQ